MGDEIRPMSIMELNCQVCKCASKIEACDNKMDDLAKTVETMKIKEVGRLELADRLVDHLEKASRKMHGLQVRQEQRTHPVPMVPLPAIPKVRDVRQSVIADGDVL